MEKKHTKNPKTSDVGSKLLDKREMAASLGIISPCFFFLWELLEQFMETFAEIT